MFIIIMRDFDSSIILLVAAGIFSLTITQALSAPSSEKTTAKETYELAVPEERSKLSNGSEDIWEKKCEENGGPEAYDTYKEVIQHSTVCFRSLVNIEQLINDTLMTQQKSQLVRLFKNHCLRTPIIHKVQDHLVKSIRNCLNPDEEVTLDTFQFLGHLKLKYICHDKGNRLATFAAAGGVSCMASNKRAFGNCYHKYIGSTIEAFREEGLNKNERLPVLGEDFRKKLREFGACTVNIFEECDNPIATKMWNSMVWIGRIPG